MTAVSTPLGPGTDRPRLTFWDYAVPVRKRWKLICALVVVCTAVATLYAATRPITYTASTRVFVAPGSGVAGGAVSNSEAVADQAAFLTSTESAATVARRIAYPGSAAGLAGSVNATLASGTNFLVITSSQSRPALAVQVVNAFARQFIAENAAAGTASDRGQIAALRRQLRSPAVRHNAGQRQEIDSEISQLQVSANNTAGNTAQIDVATSAAASTRSPLKDGVATALAVLIGGSLLAFALEAFDPRFRTAREAADAYHRRVLATVLHDAEVDALVDGRPAMSPLSREAFRQLQVNLDFAGSAAPFRTVLITSAVPGEGKSTVARNLALALGEAGRRVVLVDADLRRPRLSSSFGHAEGPGLVELCEGSRSLDEVIVDVATGAGSERRLAFVPAGVAPESPAALFGSAGFHRLLRELSERFDVVVIDSTPIVAVADALPIARVVDAVVLVARNTTDSRSALRASELLELVPDANIVGLVVNGVREREAAGYGYGYGYGYATAG
jgi:capsular exopolysaccharide synthesis family protein